MSATYQTRQVKVFGLYRDDLRGAHFSPVCFGTWREVLRRLEFHVRACGHGNFFIEGADGQLRPLMA